MRGEPRRPVGLRRTAIAGRHHHQRPLCNRIANRCPGNRRAGRQAQIEDAGARRGPVQASRQRGIGRAAGVAEDLHRQDRQTGADTGIGGQGAGHMRAMADQITGIGAAIDRVVAGLHDAAQIDMAGSNAGIDQADRGAGRHLRLRSAKRQQHHRHRQHRQHRQPEGPSGKTRRCVRQGNH